MPVKNKQVFLLFERSATEPNVLTNVADKSVFTCFQKRRTFLVKLQKI